MLPIFPLRLLSSVSAALVIICAPVAGIAQQNAPRSSSALPAGFKALRDLAYVTGGHARQKLDLYLPPDGTKRPLVVWIHGGAWEGGSKDGCPALPLLGRGFAVASLNYRLSQHAVFPAQIEDCKSAIRWLRAHAAEHGIDPERIGVWGASAGGHLAALLGTTGHSKEFDKGEHLDQSSRVQCVIDWFGPSDFLRWGSGSVIDTVNPRSPVVKLLGGAASDREAAARRASPVYFVQKDAPPFLIVHGDRDAVVPLQQSQLLHDALRSAGAESTLDVIAGSGHGGGEFVSQERRQMLLAFFERHLRVAK